MSAFEAAKEYAEVAIGYIQEGRWSDSEAPLRRAVALAPDNPGFRMMLGTSLLKLSRPDQAISEFEHAVSLDPGYPEAHASLGRALMDAGQFQPALRAVETAMSLDNDLSLATYVDLSLLRVLAQHPEEAEAMRGAAVDHVAKREREDRVLECIDRAHLCTARGKIDESIASFREAISIDPDYDLAWFGLGTTLLYQTEAREEEATEALERAVITLGLKTAEAHQGLGDAYSTVNGSGSLSDQEKKFTFVSHIGSRRPR